MWIVGRIVWTRGYLSGTPILRYGNPLGNWIWTAFLGTAAVRSIPQRPHFLVFHHSVFQELTTLLSSSVFRR